MPWLALYDWQNASRPRLHRSNWLSEFGAGLEAVLRAEAFHAGVGSSAALAIRKRLRATQFVETETERGAIIHVGRVVVDVLHPLELLV